MKIFSEYPIDGICNYIDEINNYIKEHGRDKQIQNLEDAVIKTYNAFEYRDYFEKVEIIDVKKFQDAVIELSEKGKNNFCMVSFAMCVKDADIKLIQQKIIESNRQPWYLCTFAKFVAGADKELLQNKVIEMGDASSIYEFAKDVDGANIQRLQDAILKTKNTEFINKFAKTISGADKKKIVRIEPFSKVIERYAKNASSLINTNKKMFSKIGGNPIVPTGFNWPVDKNNKKIPFFMQLDFSEINQDEKLDGFPCCGLLYIFLDDKVINTSFPLIQGDHYQLLFFNVNKNTLHIEKESEKIYKEIFLKPKYIKMYPNTEENKTLLEYMNNLSVEKQDEYLERYHFIDSKIGFVGGWPQILQTSYLQDDEIQLIQLNSVGNNFVWGDLGMLQFYIKVKDLKNLKFDDVKINIETT